MPRLPNGFAYTLVFLSLCAKASAQVDTSTLQIVNTVYQAYSSVFKENTRIYNGSSFGGYFHRINGHPFFQSAELEKGFIIYDGILYPGIPLGYDIVQDQVIINYHDQQFNLQLLPEKIREFSVRGHRFVRISADTINGAGISTGFYESLYSNDATVLAKRTKKIQYPQRPEDSLKFVQYDFYFIRMKDAYHAVNSKRSLMSLFGKQKSEVRKYLRKNGLNYKRDPGAAIIAAAKYYHQLTN
jgi:hypothetical protein